MSSSAQPPRAAIANTGTTCQTEMLKPESARDLDGRSALASVMSSRAKTGPPSNSDYHRSGACPTTEIWTLSSVNSMPP